MISENKNVSFLPGLIPGRMSGEIPGRNSVVAECSTIDSWKPLGERFQIKPRNVSNTTTNEMNSMQKKLYRHVRVFFLGVTRFTYLPHTLLTLLCSEKLETPRQKHAWLCDFHREEGKKSKKNVSIHKRIFALCVIHNKSVLLAIRHRCWCTVSQSAFSFRFAILEETFGR